jgi:hypothetical protein
MEDFENENEMLLIVFDIGTREAFSDNLTAIEILAEYIKIGFITKTYLLN